MNTNSNRNVYIFCDSNFFVLSPWPLFCLSTRVLGALTCVLTRVLISLLASSLQLSIHIHNVSTRTRRATLDLDLVVDFFSLERITFSDLVFFAILGRTENERRVQHIKTCVNISSNFMMKTSLFVPKIVRFYSDLFLLLAVRWWCYRKIITVHDEINTRTTIDDEPSYKCT